ncbi:protein angel homolog 2 isoform X2 [Archocentrus centrarchus]|nr:protein angel homolog 2 isoform X2 [Archocentrus centrarchus]XP_030576675.1 protein angel homolog 2 isoform X2 [Archocentrus centrarchus]
MFLRRLSSLSSSFPPCSLPTLSRACFKSSAASSSSFFLPRYTPTPHPWWLVRGFPPWPPRLSHSHPLARDAFAHRILHPLNINLGDFSGCRSFYASAGHMMEGHDRDRGPPYKRRKSAEEKRSPEDGEEHNGGATGSKEGGSRREHHHLDSRKDSSFRSNHHFNDGSAGCARRDVRRENSRDKDVERTKSWSKDRQWKESADRDGSATRGRREHQQEGHKESQPVMHKPNPWFRGRGSQELGGFHRDTKGTSEQQRDGRSDGGQPRSTTHPPNPWQVPAGNRQPSPSRLSLSVKSLQRHWESCSSDLHAPGDTAVFDFSVMSYNILSQQLLEDNAYLYQHCDPSVLPWEYRLHNLLAEIQQHNADILCLQEVQEDHYENQIKPALQALGYRCEYKKRTGKKPDGCAVSFRTSRFSLLSSNPVEFFRTGDPLLDRDNVGLVVLLQPNNGINQSNPSFICVANTHLLYNPRRGDIKLAQLAIMLAEINRLSRLPDGQVNPVVFCGDFNSAPWSPLHSFLTTGCLHYSGMQIGIVSGQENSPRGQRLLTSPIWSPSLGINHQCQYENKPAPEPSPSSPTAVEGAISNLSVEDLAAKAADAFSRAWRIEHSLKLQSSYQHHLMPDGRPEITTCHSRTALTVDYILYSPDFITLPSFAGGRGLQLLGRLSLVGQAELEEVNGLPNHRHSSDHLPLLARFRFRC